MHSKLLEPWLALEIAIASLRFSLALSEDTRPIASWKVNCSYRMAQNFDGGIYCQIRVGKILMSKKLMNANVFILLSSLLHVHHFISYT